MQGSSVPLSRNHISPSGAPSHRRALRIVLTFPPLTAPLRTRHHCACKDVPGEAQSLDDRSSFPKGKYSPSESESANNTCILTVQLFISHLPIFSHKSHNLLTRHELNCFRINDTIAHLLCYFLEHFWSRIEVLHVCHLVVGIQMRYYTRLGIAISTSPGRMAGDVEIAIAFPSPSFFSLLPNQIILFKLLKLFSFVYNGKVIIFSFVFL